MTYTAEISRVNPTCFLFLIDQSGSMGDPFPGTNRKKADNVADAVNRLLQNLVIRSSKSEGVRDYFHVGVIGYGSSSGPAFKGTLAGKELAPVSEVAMNPARIEERMKKVEDGAGGLVEEMVKFPIWFDPVSNGGTPMRKTMEMAHRIISGWLSQHPGCFPPIVIHITDGESTDGDPAEAMQRLTELESDDGNVLLFNVHLSSNPNAKPVEFPAHAEGLPDKYARMLFDAASPLTPYMLTVARSDYSLNLADGAKGFVLNADPIMVVTALDIGTRTPTLR